MNDYTASLAFCVLCLFCQHKSPFLHPPDDTGHIFKHEFLPFSYLCGFIEHLQHEWFSAPLSWRQPWLEASRFQCCPSVCLSLVGVILQEHLDGNSSLEQVFTHNSRKLMLIMPKFRTNCADWIDLLCCRVQLCKESIRIVAPLQGRPCLKQHSPAHAHGDCGHPMWPSSLSASAYSILNQSDRLEWKLHPNRCTEASNHEAVLIFFLPLLENMKAICIERGSPSHSFGETEDQCFCFFFPVRTN